MPQLDPTYYASQVFWLIVTFLVLYFVMARAVLPRIREVLQDRQNRITMDLERAEHMRQEAEAAKLDYLNSLDEARNTATKLVSDAADAIKKESLARHAALDKTLQQQLNEAEIQIAAARKEATKQLEDVSKTFSQQLIDALTVADTPHTTQKKAS